MTRPATCSAMGQRPTLGTPRPAWRVTAGATYTYNGDGQRVKNSKAAAQKPVFWPSGKPLGVHFPNPQLLNRHSFANNDPPNLVDPGTTAVDSDSQGKESTYSYHGC